MVLFLSQKKKEYETMNKNEMLKQMQNLLGLRRNYCDTAKDTDSIVDCIDDLAEQLCDSAVVLSRISEQLQGRKDLCEDSVDEEDEDSYEAEAIVLYAVPGRPAALVSEEWAIDEMMLHRSEAEFSPHPITENLMAVYSTGFAHEYADGTILVSGPMYICHPIAGDEEDAKMDLSAVDFCEAMSFISTHTVFARNKSEVSGFLFKKED